MSGSTTPETHPQDVEFVIVPSKVLRILLTVTAVLIGFSIASQAMVHYLPDFPIRDTLAKLFYVDEEQNLPSLFSSLLLLVCALLFGAIAHASRRAARPYVRHWIVLSLLFVLLAVDEFASLHEQSAEGVRRLVGIEGGLLWYGWVVPGMVAVAVFAVTFLRFLGHLPHLTRRRFWIAGLLFVGGVLGLEMVAGSYSVVHGTFNMTYVLIVTAEEALEMLGIVVLVYALLAYVPIGLTDAAWRLRIAGRGGTFASME